MKLMNEVEHKTILIELLKEFIKLCNDNNIKYSLIGGSLIGVIRHGGMIPWDDDIDIILREEEFEKLKIVIENYKSDRYKFVNYQSCDDNFYPFYKFIDTTTILEEEKIKNIKDYGVFLDIFQYIHVPDNFLKRKCFFVKIKIVRKLLISSIIKKEVRRKEKNFYSKLMFLFSDILGSRKLVEKYTKLKENSYKYRNSKYIMCEWPTYKLENEIMDLEDYTGYISKKFENVDVIIFENYDKILSTTFGDYMKLPPLEKQKNTHNLKVYYK